MFFADHGGLMEKLSLREMWGLFDFKVLIQKLSARRHWPVSATRAATARLTFQSFHGEHRKLLDSISILIR